MNFDRMKPIFYDYKIITLKNRLSDGFDAVIYDFLIDFWLMRTKYLIT